VITSRTPLFLAMEGRCAADALQRDDPAPYLPMGRALIAS
jgi:hypothetical protein